LGYLTAVTAAGVAAAVPVAAIAASAAGVDARSSDARSTEGSVTASVRDVVTGEITLSVGINQITCYDKALAAKLVRLAATVRS
jgi:hypothetical protein